MKKGRKSRLKADSNNTKTNTNTMRREIMRRRRRMRMNTNLTHRLGMPFESTESDSIDPNQEKRRRLTVSPLNSRNRELRKQRIASRLVVSNFVASSDDAHADVDVDAHSDDHVAVADGPWRVWREDWRLTRDERQEIVSKKAWKKRMERALVGRIARLSLVSSRFSRKTGWRARSKGKESAPSRRVPCWKQRKVGYGGYSSRVNEKNNYFLPKWPTTHQWGPTSPRIWETIFGCGKKNTSKTRRVRDEYPPLQYLILKFIHLLKIQCQLAAGSGKSGHPTHHSAREVIEMFATGHT